MCAFIHLNNISCVNDHIFFYFRLLYDTQSTETDIGRCFDILACRKHQEYEKKSSSHAHTSARSLSLSSYCLKRGVSATRKYITTEGKKSYSPQTKSISDSHKSVCLLKRLQITTTNNRERTESTKKFICVDTKNKMYRKESEQTRNEYKKNSQRTRARARQRIRRARIYYIYTQLCECDKAETISTHTHHTN